MPHSQIGAIADASKCPLELTILSDLYALLLKCAFYHYEMFCEISEELVCAKGHFVSINLSLSFWQLVLNSPLIFTRDRPPPVCL